jgi:hypothetical protein
MSGSVQEERGHAGGVVLVTVDLAALAYIFISSIIPLCDIVHELGSNVRYALHVTNKKDFDTAIQSACTQAWVVAEAVP